MSICPSCHRLASKRDGRDPAGRQRYACHACGRDFTERSGSAFAGYRWPPEVILLAVRWSLSHPLSATSVMELLADLVPTYDPTRASAHDRVRAVAHAVTARGARLPKVAAPAA